MVFDLFLNKNLSKFVPLPRQVEQMRFSSISCYRGKGNIFYLCDVENYTDQVLGFSLLDKHEHTHGIFQCAILVSIFTLRFVSGFLCSSRFD